jgi:hypothetical protein
MEFINDESELIQYKVIQLSCQIIESNTFDSSYKFIHLI